MKVKHYHVQCKSSTTTLFCTRMTGEKIYDLGTYEDIDLCAENNKNCGVDQNKVAGGEQADIFIGNGFSYSKISLSSDQETVPTDHYCDRSTSRNSPIETVKNVRFSSPVVSQSIAISPQRRFSLPNIPRVSIRSLANVEPTPTLIKIGLTALREDGDT